MSKYDKASLVHIPSGYKSGTLYNVLPNDADGDFDFSRGSTATRVDKNGLIETIATGTPRLDYPLLDGVVQDNPTLLLEPQRINIYTYSEDLSQGTTLTNTSVDETSIVSPDGSLTGNKLTQTSGAYLRKNLSVVLSGTYAWSFFAKKGDLRYLNARSLFVLNGTTPANGNTIIDLDTNTIAYKGTNVTSATIEQYPNDWIKVEIVATDNATGSGDFVDFFFTDSDTSTQSTGVAGNGYIWGVQFESGSYGTSYVPNLITGSTTRSADICNGAEADFNDSEGVLYANIVTSDIAQVSKVITVNDGSTSNRIQVFYYDNEIWTNVISGGASQALFSQETNVDIFNKVALKYKANDVAIWLNGFELDTNTSAIMPTGLDTIQFDNGSGAANFYGKTKEVIVFNEALSDTELEALTSYDSFTEMATEQLYTIE